MSQWLGRTNCPCIHEVLGECVLNGLRNCRYPYCEDFDKTQIKERFKKHLEEV